MGQIVDVAGNKFDSGQSGSIGLLFDVGSRGGKVYLRIRPARLPENKQEEADLQAKFTRGTTEGFPLTVEEATLIYKALRKGAKHALRHQPDPNAPEKYEPTDDTETLQKEPDHVPTKHPETEHDADAVVNN